MASTILIISTLIVCGYCTNVRYGKGGLNYINRGSTYAVPPIGSDNWARTNTYVPISTSPGSDSTYGVYQIQQHGAGGPQQQGYNLKPPVQEYLHQRGEQRPTYVSNGQLYIVNRHQPMTDPYYNGYNIPKLVSPLVANSYTIQTQQPYTQFSYNSQSKPHPKPQFAQVGFIQQPSPSGGSSGGFGGSGSMYGAGMNGGHGGESNVGGIKGGSGESGGSSWETNNAGSNGGAMKGGSGESGGSSWGTTNNGGSNVGAMKGGSGESGGRSWETTNNGGSNGGAMKGESGESGGRSWGTTNNGGSNVGAMKGGSGESGGSSWETNNAGSNGGAMKGGSGESGGSSWGTNNDGSNVGGVKDGSGGDSSSKIHNTPGSITREVYTDDFSKDIDHCLEILSGKLKQCCYNCGPLKFKDINYELVNVKEHVESYRKKTQKHSEERQQHRRDLEIAIETSIENLDGKTEKHCRQPLHDAKQCIVARLDHEENIYKKYEQKQKGNYLKSHNVDEKVKEHHI